MERKKSIFIIVLLMFIIGFSVLLVMILPQTCNRVAEEDIDTEIYLSVSSLVLNVGEVRDIRWASNVDAIPRVSSGGTSIVVLSVTPDTIRIRGMNPGEDLLRISIRDTEKICRVTVIDDKFYFEFEYAEVSVGEEIRVNIVSDPPVIEGFVSYDVQDFMSAMIVDFDNRGVTLLGIGEGMTLVAAFYREKATMLELWVTNRPQRLIRVPYESRYINIGQEARVTVEFDEMFPGEEREFIFVAEEGRNNLRVTSTNNKAIVTGLNAGRQRVRISHSRASESAFITFDVLMPQPLSPPAIEVTESPLIMKVGQERSLVVTLLHVRGGNAANFTYEVVYGQHTIESRKDRANIVIKGVMPGVARIRINHPSVAREFDTMIIIDDEEGFYKFDPMR